MENVSGLIASVDRGRFDQSLTEDVRQLSLALAKFAQQGKKAKGALTLKLTFSLENGLVTITPSHSLTTPRMQASVAVRYLNRDGTLSDSDPRQQDIFADADDATLPPPALRVEGGKPGAPR